MHRYPFGVSYFKLLLSDDMENQNSISIADAVHSVAPDSFMIFLICDTLGKFHWLDTCEQTLFTVFNGPMVIDAGIFPAEIGPVRKNLVEFDLTSAVNASQDTIIYLNHSIPDKNIYKVYRGSNDSPVHHWNIHKSTVWSDLIVLLFMLQTNSDYLMMSLFVTKH